MVRKYALSLSCCLFLSVEGAEEVENFVKPFEIISAGLFSMAINLPGTAFSRAVRASKAIQNELRPIIKQRKSDLLEKRASPWQDILSHMHLTTDEHGQLLNEVDISSYIFGLVNGSCDTLNSAPMSIMKCIMKSEEDGTNGDSKLKRTE